LSELEIQDIERLRRESKRKDKVITDLEYENFDLKEAFKKINSRVEKQTFNDLLTRVGMSKSRQSDYTPVRDFKEAVTT